VGEPNLGPGPKISTEIRGEPLGAPVSSSVALRWRGGEACKDLGNFSI